MTKGQSLQHLYLNTLRKERTPVSIYLVSGIKLQGQIESFDQFVVLLRNSVSQMVYKHAISTVVPAHNVRLPSMDQRGSGEHRGSGGEQRGSGGGHSGGSHRRSAKNAKNESAEGAKNENAKNESAKNEDD